MRPPSQDVAEFAHLGPKTLGDGQSPQGETAIATPSGAGMRQPEKVESLRLSLSAFSPVLAHLRQFVRAGPVLTTTYVIGTRVVPQNPGLRTGFGAVSGPCAA